jgi:rhamnosyl/mannosyltransferase
MNVLQICKAYFPENIGGVEQLVYNLSAGLYTKGIQSDVLTITRKKIYSETKVAQSKVYAFPQMACFFSCPISFQFYKAFKTIIKSYDLLNYHFPWPFADITHVLLRINKPFIITYHSDIVKQHILKPMYYPVMHAFFKRASAIVTTSHNLRRTSAALRPYQDKVKVVNIGMNDKLCRFKDSNLIDIWKSRIDGAFFLFVGVLRYYKGVEYLLEAVRHTNLRLVIVGSGSKERVFRRFAMRHHMRNVIFTGSISDADKAALLSLCYAVIAPAHLRSEAFCIALLEGLVFQKPLISTEIGTGTSFVNMHNVTGLVVPPRNPDALRGAMQTLLEDEALYKKFQENTQQHYHKYFTETKMVQKYIDVYRDIT